MSTLFDEEEIASAEFTPEDPSQPNPNPTRQPDAPLPSTNQLIPHPIVSELLLDPNTRRPVAYLFDPDQAPTRIQIDAQGIIWAGEVIVAHISPHGYIRHAMEMPLEPTPEAVRQITTALIANDTYLLHGLPTKARRNPDGTHTLHPVPNATAFDTHLAAAMAFVKVKVTKDNVNYLVTQLDPRNAAALFSSSLMREALPKIETVNQVSLPYFSPDFNTPLFSPVGYNCENKTYTLGIAEPLPDVRPEVIRRWHRRRTHTFKWDNHEIDYPTYVAQTLSGYVIDLLTPVTPTGRGDRPIIPISLIESQSTEGSSGKSILQYLSAVGPYGLVDETQVPNKEELYKALVIAVKDNHGCFFLDEAKHSMYDELLTAITGKAGGRVLGASESARGDLHVVIAATTPRFSSMMARRILSCSVSTWPDYMTRQHNFLTRTNIPKYRPHMLAFCKALVMTWVEKGCPRAKPNPQWPEYSALVGGILEANGYRNTLTEKCAAANMAREDNDHLDAQWPAYFKLLASGELTLGDATQDGKGSTPLEGIHQAKDLLVAAQAADFYPSIDPMKITAPRMLVSSLRQWLDTGNSLFGYTFKKIRRNTGTCIEICKIPVDSDQS